MKRLLSALILASSTAGALAATDAAELERVVREAGRINGLALACKRMAAVARIKPLLVERVPKTRAVGEAFEDATSAAYLEALKTQPECPDAATLEARAAAVIGRLERPGHSGDVAGAGLQEGVITRYLLQDHNGRGVNDADFRGRFQLVTFGYTSCPDVCPTALAEMAAVLKTLDQDAARVQPLFITVDPERDSREVLKGYVGMFDARILGLTGSTDLIRKTAEHFKVRFEKVREPGAAEGQYTVDHSAGIYLLAPDGRFLKKFAYGTPVADMVTQLRELLAPAR